jgi:putative ABC transport system ATP-binding protein
LEPSNIAALETRNVAKTFGEGDGAVEALRGVDLTVAPGEFVAVMGPSGSGKSTLLHVVSGLEPPSSGQVFIGGEELGQLTDDALTLIRRRRVGFVFQAFNLLDVLSAVENVSLPLVIDGVAEREAESRAREALEQVGLARRAVHRPKQMSGGEQQRVAIARALVTRPVALLADEPTGNLDSASGLAVMRILRQLADRDGQAIFMVTHNPQHAALADRLIVLRDGLIVEQRRQEQPQAAEEATP